MKERVHLPVVERPSSLRADGRRERIVPADHKGRFTTARWIVRIVLIAFAAVLPFVRIAGRPAIFLDVPARRFFFFGWSLNAQDAWLSFFVITAVGFGLVVLTTVLGRVWCGWACPQTVLLEGMFRPIERWIEGNRNAKLRRDAGPWSFDRIWRKVAKHALFVLLASAAAHFILSYFTSLPSLATMIAEGPWAHTEAFAWCTAVGVALYLDMAFFREQLCLVVCPYGRLQSVLTDDDSLIVGYDSRRGEPRGHRSARTQNQLGDCVDCKRCIVVCPTGIDIREGLQVDCIGCTQCIDACDEVMAKLEKPRGLIRYESLRALRGEGRKWWRPRLGLYAVLAVIGLAVLGFSLAHHAGIEATVLRTPGSLFTRDGNEIRNSFEVHLVNKNDAARTFTIEAVSSSGAEVVISSPRTHLDALGSRRVPVMVRIDRDRLRPGAKIILRVSDGHDQLRLEAPVIGPLHAG
jgi:cytochrome c oxidase accessory protein FixG